MQTGTWSLSENYAYSQYEGILEWMVSWMWLWKCWCSCCRQSCLCDVIYGWDPLGFELSKCFIFITVDKLGTPDHSFTGVKSLWGLAVTRQPARLSSLFTIRLWTAEATSRRRWPFLSSLTVLREGIGGSRRTKETHRHLAPRIQLTCHVHWWSKRTWRASWTGLVRNCPPI